MTYINLKYMFRSKFPLENTLEIVEFLLLKRHVSPCVSFCKYALFINISVRDDHCIL